MTRVARWLPAAALLAACHTTPPAPVRVTGDRAALDRLTGAWAGSYQSPATGRAGSIAFTMTAGEDHAHGDVIMIPQGAQRPLRPAADATPGAPPDGQPPQVLTIEFVGVLGDSIFGTLSPYVDPSCDCAVTTLFRGVLAGNTVRGTFQAHRAQGALPFSGTWEVQRRR